MKNDEREREDGKLCHKSVTDLVFAHTHTHTHNSGMIHKSLTQCLFLCYVFQSHQVPGIISSTAAI